MKLLCFFHNKKNWANNLFINAAIAVIICVMGISIFLNLDTTKTVSVDGYSAIYNGNTENKNVSLMINVYWGTEYLDSMLKTLDDNKVKATFFVGGMWVSKENDMLKKIYDAGHEIASHGFFHKDQKNLNYQKNYEEIENTHKIVKEVIGLDMTLFAPPSGSYGKSTLEAAKNLGYKTIMWSKDTVDWRDKDENKIYTRATKGVKNGDLVLMHPTEKTDKALDKILKEYARLGFKQVTVSENIK